MSSSVEYSSGDFETQDYSEYTPSNMPESVDYSEYTLSNTPESEDYTSCESSSLETPSESSASLACSENVSQEIWSD